MASDTVSISSDDDVPLKAIGTSYAPITSTSLKARSLLHCDFCEEVFLNMYDALIHNAKHIVIPLMKRELHQCPLCLFYFTSKYKLKHHTRNKHKNDIIQNNANIDKKNDAKENTEKNVKLDHDKKHNGKNTIIVKNDFTKQNNKNHVKHDDDKTKDIKEKMVTKYGSDDDDLPLVKGNFKETEQVKCETDILREALLKDVKVVIEKIELMPESKLSVKVPEKFESKPVKMPDQIENAKTNDPEKMKPKVNSVKMPEVESKAKTNAIAEPKVKISNCLRFEDDIDDLGDTVMKDLTTDCIVDMNLFDEPWLDELAKSINNEVIEDDIICIDDDDDDEGNREKEDDAVYSPSTHHDELVKPGVYRCKKCQQMFPTRFNQIQHEMSHMHIRKPRPVLCEHCDRFIANKKSLKDHITAKHYANYRPRTYQSCTKCGLKYNNYDRHLENYHAFLRCHLCNKGFESEIDRLNHIRGHLVKIKCGQCGFVASELEIEEHKRRFHKSFVNLVEFNLCDVCCLFLRNKHNTNYVFGETVSKLGATFDCEHCGNKFFHVTQVRRMVKGRPTDRFTFEKERERKKVLTNTDRLKNIQHRLKMINKLSRF